MLEKDSLPIADDDDLIKRSKKDNFLIQRIFKFFILGVILVALAALTFYFCLELITDQEFRRTILGQVSQNIVGIIIAGLAVIGINVRK